MPWLQGLIWLAGEGRMGYSTWFFFFHFRGKLKMSKKNFKRIKRFIWVKKSGFFLTGGKNRQVDRSLWAEASRQESLCNVTMSISSCMSAIGIINLIMVVSVCPCNFLVHSG